ncbi:MAG: hypothetical protein HWN65_10735 [Candidatus Helarchaeota archaeon]|nr:hypothetical protein [Candidatus Helarchaeota archaeon]
MGLIRLDQPTYQRDLEYLCNIENISAVILLMKDEDGKNYVDWPVISEMIAYAKRNKLKVYAAIEVLKDKLTLIQKPNWAQISAIGENSEIFVSPYILDYKNSLIDLVQRIAGLDFDGMVLIDPSFQNEYYDFNDLIQENFTQFTGVGWNDMKTFMQGYFYANTPNMISSAEQYLENYQVEVNVSDEYVYFDDHHYFPAYIEYSDGDNYYNLSIWEIVDSIQNSSLKKWEQFRINIIHHYILDLIQAGRAVKSDFETILAYDTSISGMERGYNSEIIDYLNGTMDASELKDFVSRKVIFMRTYCEYVCAIIAMEAWQFLFSMAVAALCTALLTWALDLPNVLQLIVGTLIMLAFWICEAMIFSPSAVENWIWEAATLEPTAGQIETAYKDWKINHIVTYEQAAEDITLLFANYVMNKFRQNFGRASYETFSSIWPPLLPKRIWIIPPFLFIDLVAITTRAFRRYVESNPTITDILYNQFPQMFSQQDYVYGEESLFHYLKEEFLEDSIISYYIDSNTYENTILKPGDTIYNLYIHNTGDIELDFDINVLNLPHGVTWSIDSVSGYGSHQISSTSVRIFNGQTGLVKILVSADDTTVPGTYLFEIETIPLNILLASQSLDFNLHVKIEKGVDVVITPLSQSIEPGYPATYSIEVINLGIYEEQIDIEILGIPAEWIYLSDSAVTVPSGGSEFITLTIIPTRHYSTTPKNYEFQVKANLHRDTSISTSKSANIEVLPFYEVEVTPFPSIQEVEPGEHVFYYLSIRNLGNTPDSYNVELLNLNADWYSLSYDTVTLNPGEISPLAITIFPPRLCTTVPRDYPLILKVISQTIPSVYYQTSSVLRVLDFYDMETSIDPSSITTEAGMSATFSFEIHNIGNAPDIYEISIFPIDFGQTYEAIPSELPLEWVSLSQSYIYLNPCESGTIDITIEVPHDWKGMEDTNYTFILLSHSLTSMWLFSFNFANLTIISTPKSMLLYILHEIADLRTEVDDRVYFLFDWIIINRLDAAECLLNEALEAYLDEAIPKSVVLDKLAKANIELSDVITIILDWIGLISEEDGTFISTYLHSIRDHITLTMGATVGTEEAMKVAQIEAEIEQLADQIFTEYCLLTALRIDLKLWAASESLDSALLWMAVGCGDIAELHVILSIYALECAKCQIIDFKAEGRIPADEADALILTIDGFIAELEPLYIHYAHEGDFGGGDMHTHQGTEEKSNEGELDSSGTGGQSDSPITEMPTH